MTSVYLNTILSSHKAPLPCVTSHGLFLDKAEQRTLPCWNSFSLFAFGHLHCWHRAQYYTAWPRTRTRYSASFLLPLFPLVSRSRWGVPAPLHSILPCTSLACNLLKGLHTIWEVLSADPCNFHRLWEAEGLIYWTSGLDSNWWNPLLSHCKI